MSDKTRELQYAQRGSLRVNDTQEHEIEFYAFVALEDSVIDSIGGGSIEGDVSGMPVPKGVTIPCRGGKKIQLTSGDILVHKGKA